MNMKHEKNMLVKDIVKLLLKTFLNYKIKFKRFTFKLLTK